MMPALAGKHEPGTAYFGVPLRSGYVRRVHEAWRSDEGHDMFMYVFIGSGTRKALHQDDTSEH